MVARLGAGLLLPLGARNKLLQAAGFAPIFPTSPMNSVAVEPFREILNEMIAKHAPNPAMVVDRHWTVQEANNSSRTLLDALQGDGSETNIVRLLTSGPQVATVIANLPEVLSELMSRVQLEALEAGDDQDFQELIALLERATARYPRAAATTGQPILPLVVNYGDRQLRFVTAIAHFGSSEDVNVRDLRLELLFPADAETRAAIADWG
ncbi:transcriptional regulator [Candidatus Viadribacter manganicus]